ncbi:MAG: hexokinase [Spirochaetaceae bacterium]|nr:hexokinase [Spirochaetaceae bacterium]
MIEVDNFLIKHKMHRSSVDMAEQVADFLAEMTANLNTTNPIGVMMLPTRIEVAGGVAINKKVIVLDAGGTNLRAALVHFNEQKEAVIEDFSKGTMPGVSGEVTAEEFFNELAQRLSLVADKSDKIGFCFSYAAESTANKDGKLITFSKEIKAPQVVGRCVGEGLLKALKELGHTTGYKVVVLNDTVTTLLMGATLTKNYGGYIGFILGTGCNTAYEELNQNIGKAHFEEGSQIGAHSQIINMESGNFKNHYRGSFDYLVAAATQNPQQNTFEKMLSGAYFDKLCKITLEQAINEGLFTKESSLSLSKLTFTTVDVSNFLADPNGRHSFNHLQQIITIQEYTKLYYLFDQLALRLAKLVAINLAAVILKTGKGREVTSPLAIIADGSAFYGMPKLKERVQSYLEHFLQGENLRYFELIKVDNASMLGAAVAALTNLS